MDRARIVSVLGDISSVVDEALSHRSRCCSMWRCSYILHTPVRYAIIDSVCCIPGGRYAAMPVIIKWAGQGQLLTAVLIAQHE